MVMDYFLLDHLGNGQAIATDLAQHVIERSNGRSDARELHEPVLASLVVRHRRAHHDVHGALVAGDECGPGLIDVVLRVGVVILAHPKACRHDGQGERVGYERRHEGGRLACVVGAGGHVGFQNGAGSDRGSTLQVRREHVVTQDRVVGAGADGLEGGAPVDRRGASGRRQGWDDDEGAGRWRRRCLDGPAAGGSVVPRDAKSGGRGDEEEGMEDGEKEERPHCHHRRR